MSGEARLEHHDEVVGAVAVKDTSPLCSTKRKVLLCGNLICLTALVGILVWLINFLQQAIKDTKDFLGSPPPAIPPAPPTPPDPPMMPWIESELAWGPAIFAGVWWALNLLSALASALFPLWIYRNCVRPYSLGGTQKEMALQEVQVRFIAENSSFDESEIGWGKRAGIKEDPMKLRDITRWDTFKCIFGPGMAIYSLCSLSFVPGIGWPRTGLSQFFNLFSSPIAAFAVGSAADTLARVDSITTQNGSTLPLLYFYVSLVVGYGTLIIPALLFVLFFSGAAAAGKDLPTGCATSCMKGMKILMDFLAGSGLALILRPMMSPFFCSTAPWGNQLIMNIDGLGVLGTPQYCWGSNWPHWLAVVLSFILAGIYATIPVTSVQQKAVRWSRERGVFQNEVREKIRQADPNSKSLTETNQRSIMRAYDSYFAGVTYSRSFLLTRALTQVLNAYFSLAGGKEPIILPQLFCNLVLLACVWCQPPSTDARENLLYRDLMIIPIMTNILALSTSTEATALPLVWFLITFLIIIPATSYHFYTTNKRHE